MKYFLDTEFIEDGHTIDLLSIGIVSADGRELYLQNEACMFEKANEFVIAHVFPHLHGFQWDQGYGHVTCGCAPFSGCPWEVKHTMRRLVQEFVGTAPEFWGYYSAYDWVALCQLYGPMIDIPTSWPYYCRDLRQALDERSLQHIQQPEVAVHHALYDAQWIAETWHTHIGDTPALPIRAGSTGEAGQ